MRRWRSASGDTFVNTTIITIPSLIHFLNMMQNHMKLCGYSSGTVKAYLGQTQAFIRFNRPVNLQNITEQDIQNQLEPPCREWTLKVNDRPGDQGNGNFLL